MKSCALFISGSENLHALSNDLSLLHWVMLPSPRLSAHVKLKHFGSSLKLADESQCKDKRKTTICHSVKWNCKLQIIVIIIIPPPHLLNMINVETQRRMSTLGTLCLHFLCVTKGGKVKIDSYFFLKGKYILKVSFNLGFGVCASTCVLFKLSAIENWNNIKMPYFHVLNSASQFSGWCRYCRNKDNQEIDTRGH